MKYLQDYMEKKQTDLFKKTGSFFAFSIKQFNEQKKEGMKYINMGRGMLTEQGNEKELIEGLDKIYQKAIKQDLKENGKDKIILRELLNHEAFYVHCIEDTVRKLADYEGRSEADISKVYSKNVAKYVD